VRATGISEDVALLLAYEKGSELIVAVGTHFNLIEFLERNRAGMSSTFVTRLKVGEILVDAKGVSRLVAPRVGLWPLVVLAFVGLLSAALSAMFGLWWADAAGGLIVAVVLLREGAVGLLELRQRAA